MGICYRLVNHTKREYLGDHLPWSKWSEWAQNPAAGAMVTQYLLDHIGDDVEFISDDGDPRCTQVCAEYENVEERVISILLKQETIVDNGMAYEEPDCPDVYVRDIRFNFDDYLSPRGIRRLAGPSDGRGTSTDTE